MEKKKSNYNPAYNEREYKWQKENTILVSVRLFKTTDADIIKALEGKPKGTEIKRLIRIGLDHDYEQADF